jgi:DICT domain-containing protein
VESLYDTSHLLAQATQWRLKAVAAEHPGLRAWYLQEARRYEQIVQRSLEVPMFDDRDARNSAA